MHTVCSVNSKVSWQKSVQLVPYGVVLPKLSLYDPGPFNSNLPFDAEALMQ